MRVWVIFKKIRKEVKLLPSAINSLVSLFPDVKIYKKYASLLGNTIIFLSLVKTILIIWTQNVSFYPKTYKNIFFLTVTLNSLNSLFLSGLNLCTSPCAR